MFELRKAKTGKVKANVLRWAESVLPVKLYISTISILEIEIGVLRAERKDDKQGKALRKWFEGQVLTVFHERVIPIDIEGQRELLYRIFKAADHNAFSC